MLTVNGIVIVTEAPKESSYKDNSYFMCEISSPDPYTTGEKHFYSISIFVPKEKIQSAREQLVEGALLYLRTAELSAKKLVNTLTKEKYKKTIIKASFNNLSFLTVLKKKNKEEARNDTTPPKSK